MVGFSSKKISNPPSLGERLKGAREEKGISLNEAAKKISISSKYLQALETGQLECMPGEVYAKNFLKVYSEFLGLNSSDFVSLYLSERKIYSKTKKTKDSEFKKPVEKISSTRLIVTPKIFRALIIVFLALVCVAYLGFKVKAIMTPPELVIEAPANDLAVDNELIEISGQVGHEATLEINGQQVLVSEDGKFSEKIDLQPGVNIIEIKALNRHGRETKIYRQVILNTENQDISNY